MAFRAALWKEYAPDFSPLYLFLWGICKGHFAFKWTSCTGRVTVNAAYSRWHIKWLYIYKLFVNLYCRVYLHVNSMTNSLDSFYNLLIYVYLTYTYLAVYVKKISASNLIAYLLQLIPVECTGWGRFICREYFCMAESQSAGRTRQPGQFGDLNYAVLQTGNHKRDFITGFGDK